MNKKLLVAAALLFGAAGLFAAGTVKAQDAGTTDNSAMNADNSAMNGDNSAMNGDNSAMNGDNAAAPAAQ